MGRKMRSSISRKMKLHHGDVVFNTSDCRTLAIKANLGCSLSTHMVEKLTIKNPWLSVIYSRNT